MSIGSPERYERQKQSIKAIRLKPQLDDELTAYAADNGISKSDAMRDLIDAFLSGNPPVKHRRRSRRISVWMPPDLWARFSARARREKVTLTELVEHVLEQM